MSVNDRHNPSVDTVAPKYYQIAQEICADIKMGFYKVGGMLPTEAKLAQMFGTSRFTVREALRIIAEQGLVERKRGSGTRVVAPMALETFVYRLSSPAEILTYPTETHRENLFRGSIQADPDLANKINCPIGKVWFRISGVRRAGKSATPISWSDIYVLPELAEVLNAAEDGRTPVFEQIEAATGIAIVDAEIRIFASSIDGRLASLLQVTEGTPALSIIRRYLDKDGRNFETTITVHPERRFEYSLQLHREVQKI